MTHFWELGKNAGEGHNPITGGDYALFPAIGFVGQTDILGGEGHFLTGS